MKFDNINVTEEAIKKSLLKSGMTFSENTNYGGTTRFFDSNGKEMKLPANFNIFEDLTDLFESVEVSYTVTGNEPHNYGCGIETYINNISSGNSKFYKPVGDLHTDIAA